MYYTKAQKEFGSDRILIVDYKELVMYPQTVLRNICDFSFLDIRFDYILLKPTCLGQEIKVNTATVDKKKIYKNALYKWKKNLSIKEKIILWFFIRNPKLMEGMALGRSAVKAIRSSRV